METVNRILFISAGVTDDTSCLKQAISFAQFNNSHLDILIIYPSFPRAVSQYEENYKQQCIQQMDKIVASLFHELKLSDCLVKIEVASTIIPHIEIVNLALNNNYHLIIKKADYNEKGSLKALDMKLLRLAPCLVWLCKEVNYNAHNLNIAVAIHPGGTDNTDAAGYKFSLTLLQMAKQLSDIYKAKLHIISCYETNFKCFMEDNDWIPEKIENDLVQHFSKEKAIYHKKFNQLINKHALDKDSIAVFCEGNPETIIPNYIKENNIDILIMGSVMHTGVNGHFIGNTAENIIQNINCTLITKKPRGFTAPI